MGNETTMSGILSLAAEHCTVLVAGAVADCDDGTQDLTVSFRGTIESVPKVIVAIINSLSERLSGDGDVDMSPSEVEKYIVTGIIESLGGEIVEG